MPKDIYRRGGVTQKYARKEPLPEEATMKNEYEVTTQAEVRQMFWEESPYQRHAGWKQNDYPADVRFAFCAFVDDLQKNGTISEELADRVTL